MREIVEDLRHTLNIVLPLLKNIDEKDASEKISLDKWSKKEILGHLIDSACNNQQKFVRTISQNQITFVGYQQNQWVEAQKYNQANWLYLIDLFNFYNLHLAHIIENVPTNSLANVINIEGAGNYTLEFIMKDYVEHLKHHLKQILPTANINSNFLNIYNT